MQTITQKDPSPFEQAITGLLAQAKEAYNKERERLRSACNYKPNDQARYQALQSFQNSDNKNRFLTNFVLKCLRNGKGKNDNSKLIRNKLVKRFDHIFRRYPTRFASFTSRQEAKEAFLEESFASITTDGMNLPPLPSPTSDEDPSPRPANIQ